MSGKGAWGWKGEAVLLVDAGDAPVPGGGASLGAAAPGGGGIIPMPPPAVENRQTNSKLQSRSIKIFAINSS